MNTVLTKEELIGMLQQEVRILLHLIQKVDPAWLDYRPTSRQRSLGELLEYFTIFVPVHLRTITSGVFDMGTWREAWQAEEATAKGRSFAEIKEAIAKQPVLFAELIGPLSGSDFEVRMEMFGSTASKGALLVRLVLCHYAAYRMQLFLYLKACGREELNTLDLWVGIDSPPVSG